MPSKSPFTKNLVSLLDERNLSLRAAAQMAGVAQSVMAGWAAGAQPTNMMAIHRLAKALGVSFEWLLTGIRSTENNPDFDLSEWFEEEDGFSGLYRLEARRLVRKKL